MKAKKITSSLLAAGMALSSVQAEPIAAELLPEKQTSVELSEEIDNSRDFISSVKVWDRPTIQFQLNGFLPSK